MLSSLTSGASGLQNFQQEMNVIGNNIANVNTTGYKTAVVNFQDAFSNTLRAPSGGTSATSGSNAIQVGTGVSISGINNDWTQGSLSGTGIGTDLAINGNGFFLVKNTATNTTYATRAGTFSVDPTGYLVTDNGERVQGYTDSTLSTIGDLKIDPGTSSASMVSYSIDPQGKINITLSDNTVAVRGQVLLQNFQDPQKLLNEGGNLFSNLDAAGPLAAPGTPDSAGLGKIASGKLELSNVDLSTEMVNLITAQRAFEANSKIITTSDEALQTIVNLKR